MKNRNILLTAFCGTSAAHMLEKERDCRTLFLPNDKVRDSEILIDAISKETFGYVICFGQKPLIVDKVFIETTAGHGEISIKTNFDCEKLKQVFEQKGIAAKLSHNAGTSFCNALYLNGLRYIFQNHMETKMVFVHIPFGKNITDFDGFCKRILSVLETGW